MVLKVMSLKGLCKNNEVLIGFPCVFIVLGLDILLSHIMTRANQWRNCHNKWMFKASLCGDMEISLETWRYEDYFGDKQY
jgi:hypothetical protein